MEVLRVNLGGEGEVPGAINQQPQWVLDDPTWRASRTGKTIHELIADGHQFVFGSNESLPFADSSVQYVFTNHVEVNGISYLKKPWVPETEIWRILVDGGVWYDDGILKWVKLWVASPS
jgi:hypothetical protein